MNKLLFCRLKKIKNKNVHLNQKFKYMYLHIKILGPGEINICCDTMLHRNNGSIFIEYLYLCMYSLRILIYFILFWEVELKRCCGDKDLRCCCNHPFYVVLAVRMQETLHTKKKAENHLTQASIYNYAYSVALHFGHVRKKTMRNSNCDP